MNKDVYITVVGSQTDLNDNKNTDTTKERALYFNKGNVHYVVVENEISAQNARYKFNHRYLEVVRNGDINAKLYFEAGKEYTGNYRTPYGRMFLTFKTNSVTISESPGKIKIYVDYSIHNESGIISDNQTEITIEDV